jgi:hypothetical protein
MSRAFSGRLPARKQVKNLDSSNAAPKKKAALKRVPFGEGRERVKMARSEVG